jgi:hypothetical protein
VYLLFSKTGTGAWNEAKTVNLLELVPDCLERCKAKLKVATIANCSIRMIARETTLGVLNLSGSGPLRVTFEKECLECEVLMQDSEQKSNIMTLRECIQRHVICNISGFQRLTDHR